MCTFGVFSTNCLAEFCLGSPAETLPEEPFPEEPLPEESLPAESLPAESLPAESLPAESLAEADSETEGRPACDDDLMVTEETVSARFPTASSDVNTVAPLDSLRGRACGAPAECAVEMEHVDHVHAPIVAIVARVAGAEVPESSPLDVLIRD